MRSWNSCSRACTANACAAGGRVPTRTADPHKAGQHQHRLQRWQLTPRLGLLTADFKGTPAVLVLALLVAASALSCLGALGLSARFQKGSSVMGDIVVRPAVIKEGLQSNRFWTEPLLTVQESTVLQLNCKLVAKTTVSPSQIEERLKDRQNSRCKRIGCHRDLPRPSNCQSQLKHSSATGPSQCAIAEGLGQQALVSSSYK